MPRAGDTVRLLVGDLSGAEAVVTAVRLLATDAGCYVSGGEGLYGIGQFELTHERTDGNPCGDDCDERSHDAYGACDHCWGACRLR